MESGAFNPWTERPWETTSAMARYIARSLNCTMPVPSTSSTSGGAAGEVDSAASEIGKVNVSCLLALKTSTLLSYGDDGWGAYAKTHPLPKVIIRIVVIVLRAHAINSSVQYLVLTAIASCTI